MKIQNKINWSFLKVLALAFIVFSCEPLEDNINPDDEANLELGKSIEGNIVVSLTENFETGSVIYDLSFNNDETGLFHELSATQEDVGLILKNRKSGKKAKIEKSFLNTKKVISYNDIKFQEETESITVLKEGTTNTGSKAGPTNSGNKAINLLVVMVTDSIGGPTCSKESMEYDIVGSNNPASVSELYNLSSRGAFTIGQVTFADAYLDEVICSPNAMANSLNPQLLNQGYVLNDYNKVMFVTRNACEYGGSAQLNGKYFHNNVCDYSVVTPHELGHAALGFGHAAIGETPNFFSIAESYGDKSCGMGIVYKEFNAPHRIEAGWLSRKNIVKVRKNQVYRILPLHSTSLTQGQVLTFNDPLDDRELYYVSYRVAQGPIDFDMSSQVANKVSIHKWKTTAGSGTWTKLVMAIDAGETHTIPGGVTISNLGIVNGKANVEISNF